MCVEEASSSTAIRDVQSASGQHEWDLPGRVPDKLPDWDYGYITNGKPIGCTREHLIEMLVHGAEIRFVWSPETPKPIFPENVPFLIDAFRRIQVKAALSAIWWGAGFVAVAILIAVALQKLDMVYRNIFFVFGAVALTEGVWVYARSRHYTLEDASGDASGARFAIWLKNKKLTGYSFTLAACIVVVSAAQAVADQPIEAAGLVKPAVWHGEIWRLFTATLMHADFMHFWMNFLALLYFSKIVERTMQRALVPLVFLLTGAVGSVFSVLLYPNTTSIGASGGLMGLLGLITIAAHLDRNRYPPKYFRQLIQAIVMVAVLGLFGFAFIDNAAHLGGLGSGLLLGWLLLSINKQATNAKERMLKFGGLAALLLLGLISATAVYHLLR